MKESLSGSMLELVRSELFYIIELITFDRLLTILEIGVIAVAAVFAYRVGRKQNQINENLLELHLIPRLTVTCDLGKEMMFINNKGASTVNIWSIQGEGFSGELVEPCRQVAPSTIFTMDIPSVIKIAREKKQKSKTLITILVSSENQKKYKLQTMFYFDFENEELSRVRCQSYPLEQWIE